MNPLAGWENFYVVVGTSAGALIGLQFVVMTLIANRVAGASYEASDAFSTPTIVHFGTVLFLAAALTAPWHTLGQAATLTALFGSAGLVYEIIVVRRMLMQRSYRPVWEDWLFHVLLPLLAYAALAAAGYVAIRNYPGALFVVAAATLLLLAVGIHNAWDAVTYHIFSSKK